MALPQSLRQMLEGGDPASAAAVLHKLRGTAGHLGATRLAMARSVAAEREVTW